MTLAQAALIFVALLVLVDPVATAPVYGALTRDMTPARARRTAAISVLLAFALLGAAGLAGHWALRAIGARMALVHLIVAAALLGIGALMLFGRAGLGADAAPRRDPTVVPLAVPLITGPGGVGAMVMFAGKYAGHPADLAVLYGLLAAVAALTYAAFRTSGLITRQLGERGVAIIARVMGAVLIAAAARFLFEALRDYGLMGARGTA